VFGRLDLERLSIPKNAEIYVCGGPKIVEEIVEKLKTLGQVNIFVEKF
jgi:NAD(P)H-flavin reductase